MPTPESSRSLRRAERNIEAAAIAVVANEGIGAKLPHLYGAIIAIGLVKGDLVFAAPGILALSAELATTLTLAAMTAPSAKFAGSSAKDRPTSIGAFAGEGCAKRGKGDPTPHQTLPPRPIPATPHVEHSGEFLLARMKARGARFMQRLLRLFLSLVLLSVGRSACAAPRGATEEPLDQTLCAIIEKAAAANALPAGFFTRLIWQENALRLDGVSPAGAEGVAQFMPGTAAERGLVDPFDPETAIPEAAKYLAEFVARFGNLGLAAAAYNAGPNRVAAYLAGRAAMPPETRAYVHAITTGAIEDWAKAPPADPALWSEQPAKDESCLPIIEAMRRGAPAAMIGEGPFAPWGVQLAGSFSKAAALAAFQRVEARYKAILGDAEPFVLGSILRSRGASPFFRVRLPAPTRADAERLCDKLLAAGGNCVVLRS